MNNEVIITGECGISSEMAGEFISHTADFREFAKGIKRLALKLGVHPDTGGDAQFAPKFFAALTEIDNMNDEELLGALSSYFHDGLARQLEVLDEIDELVSKCDNLEKQHKTDLKRIAVLKRKLVAKQNTEAITAVNTIRSRQKRLMEKNEPRSVSEGKISLSDLPNNVFLSPVLILESEEHPDKVNVSAEICQIRYDGRLRHYDVEKTMSKSLTYAQVLERFERDVIKSYIERGFDESQNSEVVGEVIGFIDSSRLNETNDRILMASFDSLTPVNKSSANWKQFIDLCENVLDEEIIFSLATIKEISANPNGFDFKIALLVICDDQDKDVARVDFVTVPIYRFLTKERKQKTASPA